MVRNLQVQNLKSGKSKYAVDLQGLPNAPIIDVRLENCTFNNAEQESIVKNVRGLKLSHVMVNGKEVTEFS